MAPTERCFGPPIRFARASQLAPRDPLPWGFGIIVPRAAGGTEDEARHMFAEAVRCHPLDTVAHDQLMTALEQRWLGSHDKMFDFARDVLLSVPDGHGLALLLARAHVSRWFQYRVFDKDESAANVYFRRKDVVADLREIAAKVRPTRDPVTRIHSDNWLGFCAVQAGDDVLAKEFLPLCQNRVLEQPWSSYAEPLEVFDHARRRHGVS